MRRLTPEEFKGIAKERGYDLNDVAEEWELSPARVSQIARDGKRKRMYDYALWGLPLKRTAAAVAFQRNRAASKHATPSRERRKQTPEPDIWTELTAVGAVWVVNAEQGDHLPQGCEGVVVERDQRGGALRITLRFSTGYTEPFDLSYLQDPACFLTATGRRESSS